MTEIEEKILSRLDYLESEIARLKSANAAATFADLLPSSVVGKDYVAWKYGITTRAVLRGESGTSKIRRVSKKPLKFIKSEVDAAWNEKIKPVAAKAAEARAGKTQRKYSLLGKNKRAATEKVGDRKTKKQGVNYVK